MRNASPSAARVVRESGIPVEVCTLLTLRNLLASTWRVLGMYFFLVPARRVTANKLTKSPEVEIQ